MSRATGTAAASFENLVEHLVLPHFLSWICDADSGTAEGFAEGFKGGFPCAGKSSGR